MGGVGAVLGWCRGRVGVVLGWCWGGVGGVASGRCWGGVGGVLLVLGCVGGVLLVLGCVGVVSRIRLTVGRDLVEAHIYPLNGRVFGEGLAEGDGPDVANLVRTQAQLAKPAWWMGWRVTNERRLRRCE